PPGMVHERSGRPTRVRRKLLPRAGKRAGLQYAAQLRGEAGGSAPHAGLSGYRGEGSVASLRARTFGRRLARQPDPLLCRSAARETSQPRSSSSGRLGDAPLLTRPAGLEFRAAAAPGRRLDERAEPRAAGRSAQSWWESVWLRERILDRARAGDREAERTLPSGSGP